MRRSNSYSISPSPSISQTEAAIVPAGHEHGYHWIVVAILIIGEMAGGGLVALPSAMVDSGVWAGSVLMIVSALASMYTGIQLGDNWLMMQERWPEYRLSCRKPYPEMANRALGPWGRTFVSVVMSVQLFSLAVVFLLLASTSISSLLYELFAIKLNFCFVATIVSLALLPLYMLGSPKDFWQAALIAMISTMTAIFLLFIGAAHDQEECMKEAHYPPVHFQNFFLAFGTIMFAYGGHACFPTFQHDMKKPQDFSKAVVVGYIVIIMMYLPFSIYGYLVYGDSLVGGTIIPSLQLGWAQTAVNTLITLHVVFTEIIVISPFTLTIEELCRVPNKFGIRRFIVRTLIMLAILIVALTIPKFGPILDLIGGSTVTLLAMVMPGVFSMSLIAGRHKRDLKTRGKVISPQEDCELPTVKEAMRFNSKRLIAINFIVIAFGVIGGIASTITGVQEMMHTSWDVPCYVQLFKGTLNFTANDGFVHCCGMYKNITTVPISPGEQFCMK